MSLSLIMVGITSSFNFDWSSVSALGVAGVAMTSAVLGSVMAMMVRGRTEARRRRDAERLNSIAEAEVELKALAVLAAREHQTKKEALLRALLEAASAPPDGREASLHDKQLTPGEQQGAEQKDAWETGAA